MYWELLFKMKKIYLICLFAFVSISVLSLVSCSKNDEVEQISTDKTVTNPTVNGKWRVVSKVKNGVNIPLDNCIQNTFIKFSPNRAYSQETSKYNTSSLICLQKYDFGTYTYSNNNLEANEFASGDLDKYNVTFDGANMILVKYYARYSVNGVGIEENIPVADRMTVTYKPSTY